MIIVVTGTTSTTNTVVVLLLCSCCRCCCCYDISFYGFAGFSVYFSFWLVLAMDFAAQGPGVGMPTFDPVASARCTSTCRTYRLREYSIGAAVLPQAGCDHGGLPELPATWLCARSNCFAPPAVSSCRKPSKPGVSFQSLNMPYQVTKSQADSLAIVNCRPHLLIGTQQLGRKGDNI